MYDGFTFLGEMFGVDVLDRVSDNSEQATGLFHFAKYLVSYRYTQVILLIIIICFLFLLLTKSFRITSLFNGKNIIFILWFIVTFFIYNLSKSTMAWYFYSTFICLIIMSSIIIDKTIRKIKFLYNKGEFKKVYAAVPIVILSLLIGYIASLGITSNINSIFHPQINCEQKSIMTFNSNRDIYSGVNAYILKDNNSYMKKLDNWEQADILVAELYGDWHCKDGGIDEFISSKEKSLLLISKNNYNENKDKLLRMNIVNKNEDYFLLLNK